MTQNIKIIPLHSSNHIDEEASLWLTKLDSGDFSEQSKIELKNWLAADTKHQEALTAMIDVWDDLDESLALFNDDKLSKNISFYDLLTPVIKPLLMAASICFVCIFVFLNSTLTTQKNTYATQVGEQLQTTFDDGSVIHLNTDSRIETEFSANKRLIKLVQGEALFDVAHDSNRPFIVYAGDRLVQAIGTKFVVNLHPDNVEVLVTEGKVLMSETSFDQPLASVKEINTTTIKKDDVFITREQKVSASIGQAPKLSAIKTASVERSLAWLEGKIIFKDEKLVDVITQVNRYIDQEILLNDATLKEKRISGRINLGDSEALIEALTLSFDIKLQRIGNTKILLSKNDVSS